MLFMMLNFFWMFISSFCVGMFINSFLNIDKKRDVHSDLSLILMLGIVGLTIYAEIFSVFYRVGFMATAILFCIVFFLWQSTEKKLFVILFSYFQNIKISGYGGGLLELFFSILLQLQQKLQIFMILLCITDRRFNGLKNMV